MNSQSLNGLHNLRIADVRPLPSPAQIKTDLPINEQIWHTVLEGRKTVQEIIHGRDKRFLAVVGPCSIHDADRTLDYARKLARLADEMKDRIYIIMRFCPDKPRTRLHWVGFCSDPLMDGVGNIALGWRMTRKLMLDVVSLELPLTTEFNDDDNFQRYDDLPSHAWIGARNVTSQAHRQMASGLSPAVGFKNPVDGNMKDAIDAIHWARHRNVFSATHDNGTCSEFITTGNEDVHLIHRGSREGPNYDTASIATSVEMLKAQGLIPRVLVDASHGNSGKNHLVQEVVINDVAQQFLQDGSVFGAMHESFLSDGNQPLNIPIGKSKLLPGISVTDACDGWERTERIWRTVYDHLGRRE